MNVIRSLLFMLYAVVVTVALVPFIVIASFLGHGPCYAMAWVWRRAFMFGVNWILWIKTEVRGIENMPTTPAVILAKHQSAWETVALQDLLPSGAHASYVLKQELMRQPFIGWALGAMKMISIDRNAGKDALAQVLEQGRQRLQQGFFVIVFPEGTRVAPGQKKRYKPGGAYLAAHAGVAAIPVAHNAGELWPRNAFIKRAGTIVISIGPAIDTAGLDENEVNRRAEEWIEGEMRRLSPHRYKDAGQG